MKKYILSALSGLLFVSCIDTSVLPDDKITGENFWQSKEQVSGMVTDVYRAMCAEAAVERYAVWGGFRSDEMYPSLSNYSDGKLTDLKEISDAVTASDNQFANWSSMYSIINKCNIVLEKAPGVVLIDPSYTQETYYTDESQMLAIRALCHFYLIRAFRDIPYSDVAYMNSSMDMQVQQLAPAASLQRCIDDLNRALEHPLSPTGFTDWRKTGLINRDAIKSILADVHLWRASMTGNKDDYTRCAQLCQEVIDSKKSQGVDGSGFGGFFGDGGGSSASDQKYPLIEGRYAYDRIFGSGNSSESIFELLFDGTNNANTAVMELYWNHRSDNDRKNNKYPDNRSQGGLVDASASVFGSIAETGTAYLYTSDYRFYDNTFDANDANEAVYGIRKMGRSSSANTALDFTKWKAESKSVNITSFLPYLARDLSINWIFYRLTDVMLMKAEALVQIGDEASLAEAFELVYEINKRSQADETKYLVANDYTTQAEYEDLVLAERLRELCFEGKRWFDLVRYNYRHVDGIQPDKMLWEIGGVKASKESFVENYKPMMDLMKRRYPEGADSYAAKMNREACLYMPILRDELKVSTNLHQNPVYNASDNYVKN